MNSLGEQGDHNIGEGYPSGRVGLYTNVANTQFGNWAVADDAQSRDMSSRWTNNSSDLTGSNSNAVSIPNQRLELLDTPAAVEKPILLKGIRLDKFQATFAIQRIGSGTNNLLLFVFNAKDTGWYNTLAICHQNTNVAPSGDVYVDGLDGNGVSRGRKGDRTH